MSIGVIVCLILLAVAWAALEALGSICDGGR